MAKRRATLRNSLYDESVEHAVSVMRRAESTREKIVANLEYLSQQLERKIKLGGLTEAQSARTRKLLSDTTTTIFSAYSTNQQLLQNDLRAIAHLEGKSYPDVLNKAFRRKLARATLSDTGLKMLADRTLILGAPAKDWWSQQSNRLSLSFATQLRIGIAAGENLNQLVARVRGRETGRVHTLTDGKGRRVRVAETVGGIMDASRAHATALVRTSYMSIVNSIVFSVLYGNRSLFEAMMAVAVLDSGTTIMCRARDGAKWDFDGMPTDDSPVRIKYPGAPPWHWQAIHEGQRITTARGTIPIEQVRVGDLVLTHKGRFRSVYSTMSKLFEGASILIKTDRGCELSVTDDHPILSELGWVKAGCLKIGDKLFKDADDLDGVFSVQDRTSDYRPPGFNESFVPDSYSFAIDKALNPLVNFQTNSSREHEVEDMATKRNLESCLVSNYLEDPFFIGDRIGAKVVSSSFHSFGEDSFIEAGIVVEHPIPMPVCESLRLTGVFGLTSPMVFSSRALLRLAGERSCLFLGVDFESVFLASIIEGAIRQAKRPLNRSQGFPIGEMPLNHNLPNFIGWQHTNIIGVGRKVHKGRVYNLGIQEDETFVCEGIIVHNCRTILVPVPKRAVDDDEGQEDERPRTYEEWLREQDEDKQKDIMGPERWKLWQSGKLSLSQLIDPSGRALPIPALKRQASRG